MLGGREGEGVVGLWEEGSHGTFFTHQLFGTYGNKYF